MVFKSYQFIKNKTCNCPDKKFKGHKAKNAKCTCDKVNYRDFEIYKGITKERYEKLIEKDYKIVDKKDSFGMKLNDYVSF